MPSWLIVVLVAPLFAWGVWRGVRDPSARGMSFWTALTGAGACIFIVIRALVT
jgi:hypothetical protein